MGEPAELTARYDKARKAMDDALAELHDVYEARAAWQQAQLARVQDWHFEGSVPAFSGSRRWRTQVTVSRHPATWAAGPDSEHRCDWLSIGGGPGLPVPEYRAFHFVGDDSYALAVPVIWRVVTTAKRHRVPVTRYYCDAHLPAEFRPDEDTVVTDIPVGRKDGRMSP
jgi:hypothetical protein